MYPCGAVRYRIKGNDSLAIPEPDPTKSDRSAGLIIICPPAVILLLAIVAAITLTMRKRPGLKVQDIAAQVAVRAKDRVRIVKMDAEKKQ